MKIILIKEVPKLGKAGEIKNVKDGYGRNFLIRRGLAEAATESNIARQAELSAAAKRREEQERKEFEAMAQKLRETPLRFALKVGEKGQAFGSVTAEDIAKELAKRGTALDKAWIELERGIRTTGEHEVKIKFPHKIESELKITVEAEK